jgi:serine/threonine protein kinase
MYEKKGNSGNFIPSEYKIQREIGSGTYAKVYLVTDKKQKRFAMKKVLKSGSEPHFLQKELKAAEMLKSNKGVIKIYGTSEDTEYIYILMELVKGGDMYDHLTKAKELACGEESARYVTEISVRN